MRLLHASKFCVQCDINEALVLKNAKLLKSLGLAVRI